MHAEATYDLTYASRWGEGNVAAAKLKVALVAELSFLAIDTAAEPSLRPAQQLSIALLRELGTVFSDVEEGPKAVRRDWRAKGFTWLPCKLL